MLTNVEMAKSLVRLAVSLAETGDKRPVASSPLLWTHIRNIMSEASDHLEQHARERHGDQESKPCV
jgi:hypothetical protein